jgi:hypothetical protein
MTRFFNLTTVACFAAVGLILAGAMAFAGGTYAQKVVHDQLAPQKIFFPEAGAKLPADLTQYAGQQVDTAAEAKAFADDYIGLHLKGIGKGQSYSQVSGAFLKDPNNQQLAQQRQTLFMGETLRGMLLNAWGWGTVGNLARLAGIVLLLLGAILLAIPLLALAATRRASDVAVPAPARSAVSGAL